MRFNLLLEDNETIEGAIKILDKLIIKLRNTKDIDVKTKQNLLEIYNNLILPWMEEFYLLNKNLSEIEEKEMIDIILDNISMINKLLKIK
jgi:hypothetical protein